MHLVHLAPWSEHNHHNRLALPEENSMGDCHEIEMKSAQDSLAGRCAAVDDGLRGELWVRMTALFPAPRTRASVCIAAAPRLTQSVNNLPFRAAYF